MKRSKTIHTNADPAFRLQGSAELPANSDSSPNKLRPRFIYFRAWAITGPPTGTFARLSGLGRLNSSGLPTGAGLFLGIRTEAGTSRRCPHSQERTSEAVQNNSHECRSSIQIARLDQVGTPVIAHLLCVLERSKKPSLQLSDQCYHTSQNSR